MFDADKYLSTIERPSIRLKGRVHTGRLLSIQEWLTFEPEMKRVQARADGEEGLQIEELRAILRRYINAVFPKPRWRFWERSVSSLILELPIPLQVKALKSFLACQVAALNADPEDSE